MLPKNLCLSIIVGIILLSVSTYWLLFRSSLPCPQLLLVIPTFASGIVIQQIAKKITNSSLSKNLADVDIHLNASVSQVKDLGSEMLIETKDGKKWSADKVVLCMPPHLVGVKISFLPYLPYL